MYVNHQQNNMSYVEYSVSNHNRIIWVMEYNVSNHQQNNMSYVEYSLSNHQQNNMSYGV
jgi:hypothetical protein